MNREQQICRVTLVGGLGNLLLVVFKFAAGILGRSSAMVADAVHSLSDFLTDIVVMVFVGISAKPQDASHDYGHGKYETLATLFIGIALVGAAVGIIASGLMKILAALHGEPLAVPGQLALWAALVSILVKEILYRYTAARARSLDSPAMLANAWHHRSDSLSSIGAALGIGGAILLGEKGALLDPLAYVRLVCHVLGHAAQPAHPSHRQPNRHRGAHPHGWRHAPPPGPRTGLVHRTPPARTLRPEYPRHPSHGAGEKIKYWIKIIIFVRLVLHPRSNGTVNC